ncbi:hypothetical protein V6N13_127000 [Hibiscus sabdariffa]
MGGKTEEVMLLWIHSPLSATPVLLPISSNQGSFGIGGESKGNIEDVGFGLGRGMWPFPGVGDGAIAASAVGGRGNGEYMAV